MNFQSIYNVFVEFAIEIIEKEPSFEQNMSKSDCKKLCFWKQLNRFRNSKFWLQCEANALWYNILIWTKTQHSKLLVKNDNHAINVNIAINVYGSETDAILIGQINQSHEKEIHYIYLIRTKEEVAIILRPVWYSVSVFFRRTWTTPILYCNTLFQLYYQSTKSQMRYLVVLSILTT